MRYKCAYCGYVFSPEEHYFSALSKLLCPKCGGKIFWKLRSDIVKTVQAK